MTKPHASRLKPQASSPRPLAAVLRNLAKSLPGYAQHCDPDKPPAGFCSRHGCDTTPKEWDDSLKWWITNPCPECERERGEAVTTPVDAERERRLAALSQAYWQGGLSEEHVHKTFKGYRIENEAQQAAVDTVKRFLASVFNGSWPNDKQRWLLLWGITGTGKTHLLSAAMRAVFMSGRTCCYYKAGALISIIKGRAFSTGSRETLHQVVDGLFSSFDLALIDEFGATLEGGVTSYDSDVLTELFDTLHASWIPVILASNYPLKDWPVDHRVRSRINERVVEIEFRWRDYRNAE